MLTKTQEAKLKKITDVRDYPTPLLLEFLILEELKTQTKLLEKIKEEITVK